MLSFKVATNFNRIGPVLGRVYHEFTSKREMEYVLKGVCIRDRRDEGLLRIGIKKQPWISFMLGFCRKRALKGKPAGSAEGFRGPQDFRFLRSIEIQTTGIIARALAKGNEVNALRNACACSGESPIASCPAVLLRS